MTCMMYFVIAKPLIPTNWGFAIILALNNLQSSVELSYRESVFDLLLISIENITVNGQFLNLARIEVHTDNKLEFTQV